MVRIATGWIFWGKRKQLEDKKEEEIMVDEDKGVRYT